MICFAASYPQGYRHFYETRLQLRLCGNNDPLIVKLVETTNETSNSYFAWKKQNGKYSHIYNKLLLLDMCSPDAFAGDIKKGIGKKVILEIKRLNLEYYMSTNHIIANITDKKEVSAADRFLVLDELETRIKSGGAGDDIPILMEIMGCDYELACQHVFSGNVDASLQMLSNIRLSLTDAPSLPKLKF